MAPGGSCPWESPWEAAEAEPKPVPCSLQGFVRRLMCVCVPLHCLMSYQEHMQTHQAGPSLSSQKPRVFKCDTCEKAFAKPSQLERHSRIHTGKGVVLLAHVLPGTGPHLPAPLKLAPVSLLLPLHGGYTHHRQDLSLASRPRHCACPWQLLLPLIFCPILAFFLCQHVTAPEVPQPHPQGLGSSWSFCCPVAMAPSLAPGMATAGPPPARTLSLSTSSSPALSPGCVLIHRAVP